MFHLGGGITFRVNVGNLLQLQSAFERNRKGVTAAQKEKSSKR